MKTYSPKQCQNFLDSAKLLLNTEKTLKDIFETLTSLHAKNKACTYFDEKGKPHSYNYASYKRLAEEYATKLASLLDGQETGSIIGIKLANSPDWPLVFWAVLMNGHKPLLIDIRSTADVTVGLLTNAKATGLICDSEIAGLELPRFSVNEIISATPKADFVPTWENKVLFCSSGTTGNAKMFVYDGDSLCGQILASLDIPKQSVTLMHPGKINILAMVPFHHVFGFMVVFLWFNFYGKNTVYPRSINSKDLLYACQAGECTHVFSVPLLWDSVAQNVERTISQQSEKSRDLALRMMDYNVGDISKKAAGFAASKIVRNTLQKKVLGTKVQFAISGGGYLNPHTATVINGLGYPLYNGYGMTEVGITSVEQSPLVEDRLKASIGKTFHGAEYKIDGNAPRGELLIKAASMHKERLIDGKLLPIELTEDGFFRSGDIAELDETGRCYIRGRMKDVIINANGENVYPDELEFIFKGISHTVQNVVLGVKEDDRSLEEVITMILQLDAEAVESDLDLIRKEFEELNNKIPNERKIQKVYVTRTALPLANGIKVKRFVVKKALEAGEMNDYQNLDGSKAEKDGSLERKVDLSKYLASAVKSVRERLNKIWAKILVLHESEISENANFAKDLGGDSMTYVSMVQDINEEFEIEIPLELYGTILTPNEFIKTVLDIKNGQE